MKMDYSYQAQILAQALPNIQKYRGKTIVIKYGGNAMINEQLKNSVISDIVLLTCVGIRVVLVHGGGPEISDMLKKIGKESRFVNGLRYTDEETMEIVQMVLCGKVNKDLSELIKKAGGKGIGLCGLDNGLLVAEKLDDGINDYGLVGELVSANAKTINDLLENDYIPIIATVAADKNGQAYNINADTAAAKIASAIGAENLILLTDIKGLMRDPNDESSLIEEVRISELKSLIADDVIKGGMIPKVDCCIDAVRDGVKKAVIIDGRLEHSILIEILSDKGIGTMIRR
ncbi:MAG: acetylglutamate kinase [Ruminococcaceae bacterium]|nr:acetylglutamate kinase [Oscillospiraceae bacterium]